MISLFEESKHTGLEGRCRTKVLVLYVVPPWFFSKHCLWSPARQDSVLAQSQEYPRSVLSFAPILKTTLKTTKNTLPNSEKQSRLMISRAVETGAWGNVGPKA